MSAITIKHTTADGTLAYGTERGDTTDPILKRHTFRWKPWRERLLTRRAAIVDKLAHRRRHLAEVGHRPWGPEHFRRGDRVKVGGWWYEVVKVNAKTLTVATDPGWNNKAKYTKVQGRSRDGVVITEAPADEPAR